MADASGLRRKIVAYRDRLAAEAARDLYDSVDEPVDTGQLEGTGQLIRRGGGRWRIWYSADYASFPDQGTRAHTIRPRNPGGVLVFQVGGRTVFATKVDHPGNEGTGWFSDTVDRAGWVRALDKARRRITFG